jgi:hypothetical protein
MPVNEIRGAETLEVTQLANKYPAFNGNQRFIIVFTRVRRETWPKQAKDKSGLTAAEMKFKRPTKIYIYMCVCVCVCVYVYICVCVCVYIWKDTKKKRVHYELKTESALTQHFVLHTQSGFATLTECREVQSHN